MFKPPDFQPSRRKLLGQSIDASLGMLLFPQLLSRASGVGESRSLQSLLATASVQPKTLSQSPITAAIHFTAKSDQTDLLKAKLIQALPQARKARGCRYAQLYIVASNLNQMVLFKGWDSFADQQAYLLQEQRSGQLEQLLNLVAAEPSVEYWEFQPSELA